MKQNQQKKQVVVKDMNKNILSTIILVLNHLQYDLVHKDLWCLLKQKACFSLFIYSDTFDIMLSRLWSLLLYFRQCPTTDIAWLQMQTKSRPKKFWSVAGTALGKAWEKQTACQGKDRYLHFVVFFGFFFLSVCFFNFNFYWKQIFVAYCHAEKTIFWHAGKSPEFGRLLHV